MRKLLLLSIFLILTINIFSQKYKSIKFDGFQQWIYHHPVIMPSGEWDAYYQNGGQNYTSGKITIDESKKIFKVIFINGESWFAKNIKKETINEKDDEFGDVIRIVYIGVWSDILKEAKLVITHTKNNGCITQVYSRRIIDEEKKLDCYKIISTFATGGECLE